MSATATALETRAFAPRLVTSVERLRCGLLWLTAFCGAFVFVEPSPYEVASLLAMIVFAVTGLTLRPALMPLMLLLIVCNMGFSIAVIPLMDQSKPVIWVFVSWYMATTAVFFAAALGNNTPQRLDMLMRGYTLAALLASAVAILAYFRLIPLADMFLRFDRARGTFNDPNVLGAFLILPALLAIQRVVDGNLPQAVRAGVPLVVMVMALFLTFSRGAWAQLAGAAVLMLGLMFLTSRSNRERVRIVGLAIAGAAALALFIAALLTIDQVANLFAERASLEQSYDTGHTGRFGRHLLGFILALETPLGIGPLQFVSIFPEDPHNSYLNAFMSGGWISGFCYPLLVLLVIVTGFRYAFVPTPWRKVYLAVYAAYVGVAGESLIIDTDHWRHYFLLLGTLWGLIVASQVHRQRAAGLPPR